jgi:hypothetical protein
MFYNAEIALFPDFVSFDALFVMHFTVLIFSILSGSVGIHLSCVESMDARAGLVLYTRRKLLLAFMIGSDVCIAVILFGGAIVLFKYRKYPAASIYLATAVVHGLSSWWAGAKIQASDESQPLLSKPDLVSSSSQREERAQAGRERAEREGAEANTEAV